MQDRWLRDLTRRHLFQECGVGLGKIALTALLTGHGRLAANPERSHPILARKPHFTPRVDRVIFLFMAGAPSQLDLFDYKPELLRYDGTSVPQEVVRDQRYAFIERDANLMASRFSFKRYGQSGAELSEIIPRTAAVADDLVFIRSMTTDVFNHAPAQIFMNTGTSQPGHPSLGSWITYGLGSEAEDLPGFVVLSTGNGTSGGQANWSCGFLPTVFQGVPFRSQGDPVLNLSNPPGFDDRLQRDSLDLLRKLNRHHAGIIGDPEISTRISSYELAYRMQSSAPELMDLSQESPATLEMYGAEIGEPSFAVNCLLARRLVERGVRFVNVYHSGWDHHSDVKGGLIKQCGLTDQASAALVRDLKQRGLLERTLVIWGGEFGRTPMVESNVALGRKMGRDHHPQAFTMWLAGGGLKVGQTIGRTDDLGFHVVENSIHVHDLQATILQLLGFDHTRLTFRFKGRDFRLTDVGGRVIQEILA